MMRTVFLFVLFPCALLNAQPSAVSVEAEPMHTSAGMYSAFNNPAALSGISDALICAGQMRGFLLRDLDRHFLSVVTPFRNHSALAVSLISTGNTYFRQQYMQGGYARKFGEVISVYMGGWIMTTRQGEGYGTKNVAGCSAGFKGDVGRQVTVSTLLQLPVERDSLFFPSAVLKSGAAIRCSDLCYVEGTGTLQAGQSFRFVTGVHYLPNEKINFRCGIQTQPFAFYAGFGIIYKRLQFDFSASHHPQTGLTPRLALAFHFGKKRLP